VTGGFHSHTMSSLPLIMPVQSVDSRSSGVIAIPKQE
jgi:hypothetical protein